MVDMDVDDLLNAHDEKVARMARALRAVVGTAAPDAEEVVQEGWGTIGYRIEHHFLAIAPREDHVRLRFEVGVELPDPDGILNERGKRCAVLIFREPEEIDWLQITRYVQNAAEFDRWGEIERVA
ncbi:MAG: DUF1801 domain-containing protein [Planctomycetota bacterium]|nr:MAG: DUF1801 domain-containing protein [Planctomycetota bacterium]